MPTTCGNVHAIGYGSKRNIGESSNCFWAMASIAIREVLESAVPVGSGYIYIYYIIYIILYLILYITSYYIKCYI